MGSTAADMVNQNDLAIISRRPSAIARMLLEAKRFFGDPGVWKRCDRDREGQAHLFIFAGDEKPSAWLKIYYDIRREPDLLVNKDVVEQTWNVSVDPSNQGMCIAMRKRGW